MDNRINNLQNKIRQLQYDISNCQSLLYSASPLAAKNMQNIISRMQDDIVRYNQTLKDEIKNSTSYSTDSDYY
jgi:hypothetical protein